MTNPVFHDAKGRLTAYAMACGYIQPVQLRGHAVRGTVERVPGCSRYWVRIFLPGSHRLAWEDCKSRVAAFKLARRMIRAYEPKKGN